MPAKLLVIGVAGGATSPGDGEVTPPGDGEAADRHRAGAEGGSRRARTTSTRGSANVAPSSRGHGRATGIPAATRLLASAVRRQNHSEREAAQLRETNHSLREQLFHQQMAAAQRQANAEEHEGEPREQRAHTSQSQRQCDQSSSSSSNADEDEDTEIPTIDVMTKSGSRIEKKFGQPLLVTPCQQIDLKVVIRLLKLLLARISNHASSDPKNAKAAISSFIIPHQYARRSGQHPNGPNGSDKARDRRARATNCIKRGSSSADLWMDVQRIQPIHHGRRKQ
ncbi:hypothetical protein THAOC_22355, partial [Thalassiosira oceanica]